MGRRVSALGGAIDWLASDSERLSWRGVADFDVVEAGLVPLRLPREIFTLLSPGLKESCQVATGVRLGFSTNATEIRLRARSSRPCATVTMISGDHVVSRQITDGGNEVSFGPPGGETVEIWLPHIGRTEVWQVGTNAGASIELLPTSGKHWVTYGSSITQGIHVDDPAMTWSAQVARHQGFDLVNLGFASEAHLDPAVAHHMAEIPADIVTIASGINVYINASMSLRTYRSALLEFIRIVRSGHPEVPIVVLGAIASPPREDTPCHPRAIPGAVRRRLARVDRLARIDGLFGPTLMDLREATAEAVATLTVRGDDRLCYVDGRELLGIDDKHALVDDLHPGQVGNDLIAERYRAAVLRHCGQDWS